MPYTKKPRPYKKEYEKQKERGEHPDRMERQRARRAYDKKGVKRKGKDVSHKKALVKAVVIKTVQSWKAQRKTAAAIIKRKSNLRNSVKGERSGDY